MGRVLQSYNQDGVVGRGGLWKETPFSKKTCNLFFFIYYTDVACM